MKRGCSGFSFIFMYISVFVRGQIGSCRDRNCIHREHCGLQTLNRSTRREGVGIVLIAVSSIVWKINSEQCTCCTNHPISSPVFGSGCSVNALSGPAGANSSTGNLLEPTSLTNVNPSSQQNTIYGHHHHRRFLPRLPNGSGRSNAHHTYGAMFYTDFGGIEPPPPSYAASMQEYRLRMLFYERANIPNNNLDINSNVNTSNNTSSPINNSTDTNSSTTNDLINNNSTTNGGQSLPSTTTTTNTNTFSGLLSNLGSFVSNSFSGNHNQQNSPPPTYRTTGSTLAGALCRSLAFYNSSRPISRPPIYRSVVAENQANRNQNNNVSNRVNDAHLSQDTINKKLLTSHSKKLPETIKNDVHRVTIHQTNTSSQVCTNDGVNIVAISACLPMNENHNRTSADVRTNENEVQILAHL